MSAATDLLADAYGRIDEGVSAVVDCLTVDQLAHRVEPDANSIAWLVWHLARVQDDHVADVAGTDQVWRSDGWEQRFGLALPADATGYGHSSDDVAAVRADAELLAGYASAVTTATQAYLATLDDAELDRVVDDAWDPPVTLAARLVSVVEDDLKHLGQAELLRGLGLD